MLGSEFLESFAVDLPQIYQIQVFVKTVNEFTWGDRFYMEDPAHDYLDGLGYTNISIVAAKEINGRWMK